LSRPSSRFQLRPSPALAVLIVLAHAGAAGSALLVFPAPQGALLAVALLALGATIAWSRALLRGRNAIRALRVEGEALRLELAGGDSLGVELSARRYVSRWLVSLPVRRPARRTILVTRDMLEPDSFRRLRLWLLWGKLPVAASPRAVADRPLP
jgi:toxin CptA